MKFVHQRKKKIHVNYLFGLSGCGIIIKIQHGNRVFICSPDIHFGTFYVGYQVIYTRKELSGAETHKNYTLLPAQSPESLNWIIHKTNASYALMAIITSACDLSLLMRARFLLRIVVIVDDDGLPFALLRLHVNLEDLKKKTTISPLRQSAPLRYRCIL